MAIRRGHFGRWQAAPPAVAGTAWSDSGILPSGRLCATLVQPPSLDAIAGEACSLADRLAGDQPPAARSPARRPCSNWSRGAQAKPALPAEAARAVCVHPEIVARALRGQSTEPPSSSRPRNRSRAVPPQFLSRGLVGNRDLGFIRRGSARAQTSYPMTLTVEPIAVSRGQTAEITISGRENFSGAWKLLCEGPGLRGEVQTVETVEAQDQGSRRRRRRARRRAQVRARLEVARDAPLGPARAARRHTAGCFERRAGRRRRRSGRHGERRPPTPPTTGRDRPQADSPIGRFRSHRQA